jgi:hypothetical protein
MKYPRDPVTLHASFSLLDDATNVSYVLDHQLRIVETNRAWNRFALENGGEQVVASWRPGAALLDVIPDPLKPFYRDGFARAAQTADRWDHDYECSSPTVFRKYRMITYPFDGSFLVTHALLVEKPHAEPAAASSAAYERDGVIAICSHCRRVRHAADPSRWDWVPAYLAPAVQNLSHGLCPPCFSYYYD